MLAATVGKTAAKELAEDFVIGQVSMGTGSLVQNVTGNADLGTLAGVTAGITAGKGSGKALHSVDNVASGVKSIKQIDSAASGIKSIDSVTQSGVSGGNESSNSLINIDAIRPQLKTEPNTAFFWSGRTDGVGGAEVAADIAKGRGGVTLESTIEAKKIFMPEWDFNNPSTMEAWDLASGAYAEQVSGEIRAVIGSELRPGNIWENVELPRLKNNPNVTKIITIDPKTGIEKIIFER